MPVGEPGAFSGEATATVETFDAATPANGADGSANGADGSADGEDFGAMAAGSDLAASDTDAVAPLKTCSGADAVEASPAGGVGASVTEGSTLV